VRIVVCGGRNMKNFEGQVRTGHLDTVKKVLSKFILVFVEINVCLTKMETPPPNTSSRNTVNNVQVNKIETPNLIINSAMEYEEINPKSLEFHQKVHLNKIYHPSN